MIKVLDNFISWQGEGKYAGELSYFIRFKNCNLLKKCILHPCDTYELMKEKEHELSKAELIEKATRSNFKVVITGGEPTLYIDDIFKIYNTLYVHNQSDLRLSIETNGHRLVELIARFQDNPIWNPDIAYIAYSPKQYNYDEIANIWWRIYRKYNVHCDIKFVIGKPTQQFESTIDQLIEHLEIIRPFIRLMPYGDTIELMRESMPMVQKIALKYQLNISDRLHIVMGVK